VSDSRGRDNDSLGHTTQVAKKIYNVTYTAVLFLFHIWKEGERRLGAPCTLAGQSS